MKHLTNTNSIRIALFATFLLITSINLSAQYKLNFEWRSDMERIVSITKSDNDSLLYVSFENLIATVKTSDGSITKFDTVDGIYNLKMSKDGKTLAASGGGFGVGLLDPLTFKKIYWEENANSDYTTLTFNEVQNKIAICGNTFNNPKSSFIKVYDVNTKSLFKEFSPSYFGQYTNNVKRAMITDDSKYIIYSMASNLPNTNKSFLIMIDLEGKVVKDFGETSSTQFTFTYDGKTLIYFMSDAIHFFDFETMKEKEGILYNSEKLEKKPLSLEVSNDGKFMLFGLQNGLIYCDFETKKTFYIWDSGTWSMFKLNKDKSSLFFALNKHISKFAFEPNTSIFETKNELEWTINLIENKIILTNLQNHQINTLTAYDILGRTYSLSANGNEVDVSVLAAGRYFLKVGIGDGSFLDFGFVKE